MLTQTLPVRLRSRGQLVWNYLKQHSNIISWNEQRQTVYKNDVIENSNMIDLLLFSILLFVKAIAECNVPLEWIKNKDKLTMVKMVK